MHSAHLFCRAPLLALALAEFAALVKSDIAKYATVIKAAGMRID